MGDERLNGLMLMAVEKNIVISEGLGLADICGCVCSKTQKTTTKLCYRKDDCTMRLIYGCHESFL